MSLRSASRTTGTIRPLGVSAAKPMWMYFLRTRFSPLGIQRRIESREVMQRPHAGADDEGQRRELDALLGGLLLSLPRSSSRSVMSASSNCVTCGRFTQLACSRAPEIFWMRVSGLVSTGPKAAKSTTGTLGRPRPPGAAGRRAAAAPPRR